MKNDESNEEGELIGNRSAHEAFAPDESLSVCTHGPPDGYPCDPHACTEDKGEDTPLRCHTSGRCRTHRTGGLTTATFHFLLTGAFGVNMIVRRRLRVGVFNHSREDMRSRAYARKGW